MKVLKIIWRSANIRRWVEISSIGIVYYFRWCVLQILFLCLVFDFIGICVENQQIKAIYPKLAYFRLMEAFFYLAPIWIRYDLPYIEAEDEY